VQAVSTTVSPQQILFHIVPEESEARYILDELDPLVTGLVGRTNQIAGDILIDFEQPARSRVGSIRINLRTLRTNNSNRDGAVRAEVLLSAQPEYEFTEFTPTGITGLPNTLTLGEAIHFQVAGDLPLPPVSESEVRGLAHTTIQRADYDLLQAFLADRGVSEEIVLELEFVARAVEG
jgi:polyisoprenoid-binding protein YceI